MHGAAQPLEARLQGAIEIVYDRFAAPVPPVIEGCPCCIDTRGTDVLLTTPLRQLSGQALWRYVSGAFYTVGAERDFRYLLPRILEIAATQPEASNDVEIVLGKLRLANWASWPDSERQAIEALIDAWLELTLARDLAEAADGWLACPQTENILCAAARADLPLDRWLTRLKQPDATPVLAILKDSHPGTRSAFWEDAPAGLKAFSALLD